MTPMPYRIDRTLVIHALPDTVFSFFTSSERWASWWGAGSTIDPAPGGAILIRYPNGVEAIGTVVDVVPDARLVFTFGFRSGQPIAPDHSRVTITLAPHASGTLLSLEHAFDDDETGRIAVVGERAHGSLRVAVVDNGRGLPDDFSLTGNDRLGLQIVRTLVDAELHATLEVRPRVDGKPGAVATFNCPIHQR